MALYISEGARAGSNGVPQLGQDEGFDWGGLISSGLDIVKSVVGREVAPTLPKITLPSYSPPVTQAPSVAPRPAAGAGVGTVLGVGLPILALGAVAIFLLMRRR